MALQELQEALLCFNIISVTLAVYVSTASEPLFAGIQSASMLCVKKSTGRIFLQPPTLPSSPFAIWMQKAVYDFFFFC
jgi:hypothetical protein